MFPTYVVVALALLVALGVTSILISMFRPAGMRRRVVVAGLAMGIVPVGMWLLHSAGSPVAIGEALLVTVVSVFFTVNGCNWAGMDSTPSVVVARTIHFQASSIGAIVIPSEYVTDPVLSVPQHTTMYHLPRLQRTSVRAAAWTPGQQ